MSANRVAYLRAMAEHPRSDPREAELARAELRRLSGADIPRTATVRIDGDWLLVRVGDLAHYEDAKSIVLDVMGTVGRIGNELAVWTSDEEDRDQVADALRGSGYAVEVAVPRPLRMLRATTPR